MVADADHLCLSLCHRITSWNFALPSPGRGACSFRGQLPDYFDFLYYARGGHDLAGIGRGGRFAVHAATGSLMHSVSAFAFNMLVLALSINVMASAMR